MKRSTPSIRFIHRLAVGGLLAATAPCALGQDVYRQDFESAQVVKDSRGKIAHWVNRQSYGEPVDFGQTANGTRSAVLEVHAWMDPSNKLTVGAATILIGDLGVRSVSGTVYNVQLDVNKTSTGSNFSGPITVSIYGGDPERGGVWLASGTSFGNEEGPLSFKAIAVNNETLFLRVETLTPVAATDYMQAEIDNIRVTRDAQAQAVVEPN
jgi:hypothetical protein